MARASTKTILPLDRFAEIVGINRLHFNQVYVETIDPDTNRPIAAATVCGQPIVQYAWQTADRVGREEVAFAIREAEEMLAAQLRFPVGPMYIAEETVEFPKPFVNSWGWGFNTAGLWTSINAKNGMLISGGRETKLLVSASVPIVYSDSDSDGYFETATITFATSVLDEQEIAVFYPGVSGDFAWQIRPLRDVSIVAGVATVVFRREQCLLPERQESLSVIGADGLLDANFLDEVDVYRLYNDPNQMVRFLWESGSMCGSCADGSCSACVEGSQYGCLLTRLPRQGVFAVSPADWDDVNEVFTPASWGGFMQPHKAKIWYRAGYQNNALRWPLLQMDPIWERAVSYLTLALLHRPMCACDSIRAYAMHWIDDMASTSVTASGGTQTFKLADDLLRCPLGTTRAALYAWQHVIKERVGDVVLNA